ncbi:Trypsin domain protein [Verrucomicrobiia bacterium DG1235]|nr:Trypsin domain protein [Verrucomicrobiae bacterium DG1235]
MYVALKRMLAWLCLGLCGTIASLADDPSNQSEDLITPSVIGGTNAPLNKYPWVVALVGRPGSVNGELHEKQFCTGVLIHPYWVLTAAHCVSDLQSYEYLAVAAGNGNLQEGSMNEHVVDLVVRHHYYAPEIDLEADVALVRLMEPVLDRAPIAINFDDDLDEDRDAGRILGWGRTNNNFDAPDQVKRLQEASLPIPDRALANSAAHFNGALSETMIAAGKGSPLTSGFVGDSGGPFVMENVGPEDYVLLGITSWGYTCDLDTTPYTVFGSVSQHTDWIDSVISPDNLELNEASLFAKYKEVETLENKVQPQPFAENGTLGFSLELPMNGRSDLRLEEGVQDDRFGDPILSFSEVDAFSPLEDGWNFDYERGVLERKVKSSSTETDQYFLRIEQEAGISPRPGPYPLSPGMLASGKRLAESSLFGDRTIWFELLGHQAGDLITFTGWSPGYIGMAIVECDGDQTRLAAKNFEQDGSYPWGTHLLDVRAKKGMRYYGIVHESNSFEVSCWVNLDRKEIRLNEPIFGTLGVSDMRTPRNGHFCEFFEMHDKSRQDLLVELYSDFDGTIELIELESGKVLSTADDVNGSGTESLVFYHKDTDKSLGIRIMNTNSNEIGDYRIEFKRFSKPRGLRVGASSQSALMESSESQYIEGQTVYIDDWDLEGLTAGRRTYVSVEGVGGHNPQFAILDVTGRETVFEGFSICPDDSVASFVPASGRNYVLLIAGIEGDLNRNYKVTSSRNPIILSTNLEGEKVKRPMFPMNMQSVISNSGAMDPH